MVFVKMIGEHIFQTSASFLKLCHSCKYDFVLIIVIFESTIEFEFPF